MRVLFLLAALVIVGHTAARAEEPEPITYYETATVRARPLTSATASVTVLEREEIEALNVATVGELIRFIPGLDATTSGPRGGVATAQIRGGDPNFTAVLIDGLPLNDSSDQFGGAVNLNSLPVAHIERVEIVRGPLSSFFGSTGLGGAINIITRRGGSETPPHAFSADAGDASVLQTAASFSQGAEKSDYFVGASWEQEDERIADDSFESLSLLGNVRRNLGERSTLRLVGRVIDWEAQDYPDASGGPVFGSGETRSSDHEEASFGIEWQLGKPERRHKLAAGIYRHELDQESPAVPPVVPASIVHTVFTDTRAGWTYPALQRERTALNVGVEVERQKGDNDSVLFLPPEFGGDIDGSYRIDRTIAGAFLELLAERGPLLFELGARVDAPEDFDEELSPRLGLTYQWTDATRLRLSAGRAFKLPSFFALASPPALGGNPNLSPEVAVGADLGIHHTWLKSDLAMSFTIFHTRFEDLVDFDFDTFTHVNRSKVESKGAELFIDWKPTQSSTLRMNVTRQEVENLDSSEELRHRPDWVGGVRFTQRIGETLRWEVDGQSVSESFDQQIPVSDRFTTAGYTIFGTALAWDITPSWQVRGRADNLADKDYEALIGFPGPGRSYRIGLAYRSR